MRRRSVYAIAALTACAACAHDYQRWAPVDSAADLADFLRQVDPVAPPRDRTADRPGAALGGETKAEVEGDAPTLSRSLGDDLADRLLREPTAALSDSICIACDAYRVFDAFQLRGVGHFAGEEERRLAGERNHLRVDRMYGEERGAVVQAGRDPWFGVALSGGGVRSASFATGVLEGLHEIGLLSRIGYLSTVSGGGYAASWYMTHDEDPGVLFQPGSLHLQHLGQNGYYLTRGHFTNSRAQVGLAALLHVAALPLHWLHNAVLDTDYNIVFFRDWYRSGLQRGFQYRVPLARPDAVAKPAVSSMRGLLPSAELDRPYWIVNCHLALTDEKAYQRMRSGDAFEIAPLRCGSNLVGYVETEPFETQAAGPFAWRDNDRFWMQPTYAVAASGAAVDSKSLQAGDAINGLTQSLNLDLGYYVPGWSSGFVKSDEGSFWHTLHWWLTSPLPIYAVLGRIPVAGLPTAFGATAHDHTRGSRRYYLTDGGHFENLGVYSLVRRGCRLIVVADATRDEESSRWDTLSPERRAETFSDLRRLELLLHQDFGAELEMEWDTFSPTVPNDGDGFGSGLDHGVFVGRIRNLPIHQTGRPGGDEVVIVYVKAAYSIAEALRRDATFVDALKAESPDFPNDSTLLQFYDERRVASYRVLGRELIRRASGRIVDLVDATLGAR